MFRNITLGQYYAADSQIHRLDPRVKLLGVVVYIAAQFIINNIWGLIILAGVLALVIKATGIPFGYMLKGLRAMAVLIILAVVFNIFSGTGNVIWQWWILKFSMEGVLRAAFFALRLICVVLGTSILTYTTTPTTLTAGLEQVFSHLRVIKFPAHEIAMMMSIALRFIPLLVQEADKIMKAQQARGVDFESGKLMHRIKNLVPLMIPLFIGAFHIAQDLALAMEARCYRGGEGRTRLHTMRLGRSDAAAFVMMAVFAAMIIVLPLCEGRLCRRSRAVFG